MDVNKITNLIRIQGIKYNDQPIKISPMYEPEKERVYYVNPDRVDYVSVFETKIYGGVATAYIVNLVNGSCIVTLNLKILY